MKIYRCDKKVLKWQEMPQTTAKLKSPLLIDKSFNVLLGNCLQNRNDKYEIIIMVEDWQLQNDILYKLEKEIFDAENPEQWLYAIDREVTQYLKEELIVNKQEELFEYVNTEMISVENYKRIRNQLLEKSKEKKQEDYQLKLFIFDDEIEEPQKDLIEIDLEIMKELL